MYKTYILKIQNTFPEYFDRLFLEAKWLYNYLISVEDVYKIKDNIKQVEVLNPSTKEFEERELKLLSSCMRQELRLEICNNIKSLSSLQKMGRKTGDLKFKRKIDSIPLSVGFRLKKNKVSFQVPLQSKSYKKWFKVFGLKQVPSNCEIKRGILIRKASGLYLFLNVKLEETQEKSTPSKIIGVDFGIDQDLVFSDGTSIVFLSKQQEGVIRRRQKSLSKKTKGSKNWNRTRTQLVKSYEKLDNIKKDTTNKILYCLRDYKVVFQDEMLNSWQRDFGKKIQSSILGRVKSKLQLSSDNLMLDKSLPTTKSCYKCDKINNISLDVRLYSCDCGYYKDRDVHAACNMLKFSGMEYTLSEKESDLFFKLSSLKSKHFSVKQKCSS